MRKLWWLANIYWIILIMYGGGKFFTYGFDTSELGETASYALILLVLISASVLIIEFQAAWGIWLHNFDKKIIMIIRFKKRRCFKHLLLFCYCSHKKLIICFSTCLL
ncbi:MAG: DUF3923 family protein [Lactobacillus johnsonii]|nr:DUF3923 family protein [Lactobacillus johnsonii]